jgi:transcription elongation GreA/GreB family factor
MATRTAKELPKNYVTPAGLQRLRDERRFLTRRIDAAHVVDPEAPRSGRAATHAFFGATVLYRNAAGAGPAVPSTDAGAAGRRRT